MFVALKGPIKCNFKAYARNADLPFVYTYLVCG